MLVGSGYASREICDGQSLASPGRWPPEARNYPTSAQWSSVKSVFVQEACRVGTPELLTKLAMGQVKETPFPEEQVTALKRRVIDDMAEQGLQMRRDPKDREDVLLDYRFLELLLRAAKDPDVTLGEFAKGVRVGPGARLPRLPALYKPKRKWRLQEQANAQDYLEGTIDEETTWRKNYASVEVLSEKVVEVLRDQAARGQVLILSEQEAKEKYPGLVIASLGAQRKDKPDGVVTARVLFDGTHGIPVNKRTRIRDQERGPVASDLKRVMREKSKVGQRTFALTADITEAHRQVPIAEEDWHLLGCQVVSGAEVYINKVGTFGVASASYYWSRVASAIGRLAQYLAGKDATTWHVLTADDYHLEAGGVNYRVALILFFLLCATCRVPLSWHKTAGGDTVTWVGYELLHRSYELGISVRRAEWFVRWSREVASTTFINVSNFEEGLGRIMYVLGALEFERPFLGPLYRFLTLHPRGSVRRVPSYVSFILRYLARQVERNRHYPCAVNQLPAEHLPRVDAQASRERTGIGGWLPVCDEFGRISTARSPWFSLEITRDMLPWVYAKGDKPALVIATLEALAVVVSLRAFYGRRVPDRRTRVTVAPTWTDNRGNGAALNKLMSTKYPASAVLMELASYMKEQSLKVLVEWSPRSGNQEADRLANGVTTGFTPENRVHIDLRTIHWTILDEAIAMGKQAEDDFQRARATGALPNRGVRNKRRRAEDKLRQRDPW